MIPNYIVQRNFEPQTLSASSYINQSLYACWVETLGPDYGNFVFIILVDPLSNAHIAVADFNLGAGIFYSGLTYDDVGGLAYLLSTNNVAYETLLSGVVSVGTNANSFVNDAWRPGVDKVTFIPQPVNSQSGTFLPTTNYFIDNYIINGVLQQQQVARIISQPDFLFSAGDVTSGSAALPFYTRTGTTNWLNNALANGSTNGAGPGVIQPQVEITFNKLGLQFYGGNGLPDDASLTNSFAQQSFGSFDGSTNVPVVYPIMQTGTNQFTVRMWPEKGTNPSNFTEQSFEWKPSSLSGAQFIMQTSTSLTNWVNLFTVSNDGSICTFFNYNPSSIQRFYRLVPQLIQPF